jgi:large subunit ribosomal protein L7/L12
MSSITTNLASKTLKRRLLPFTPKPITIISRSSSSSSSSSETQTQKLERIADVLLDLTKIERHDYAILFRHKMGLGRYGPAVSGAILSGPAAPGSASGDVKTAAAAEKTAFDIKLEKFDAAAKIKVIKEVRTFTDLGLKEAKDLVEKVPVVLKKGLTKEEAGPIIEKLKALGATVVLE